MPKDAFSPDGLRLAWVTLMAYSSHELFTSEPDVRSSVDRSPNGHWHIFA